MNPIVFPVICAVAPATPKRYTSATLDEPNPEAGLIADLNTFPMICEWVATSITPVGQIGDDVSHDERSGRSGPTRNWIAKIDGSRKSRNRIVANRLAGPLHVKRVILVATNSGISKHRIMPDETNHGFYTQKGYDFAKIRKHCNKFFVLHSKDDQWVPYTQGIENAEGLCAQFLSFDDRGHFGQGVSRIPELLELTLQSSSSRI